MKSFTDILQSKKLTEILPPESADMCYIPSSEDEDGNTLYTAEFKSEVIFDDDCIHCWSLTALLNVIPQTVGLHGDPKNPFWYCEHFDFDYVWTAGKSADNPIDAVYNLVFKLKERNTL